MNLRKTKNEIRNTKKRSGFTLVELLIAMGILTILMTIIMRVFLQIIEMRLEAQADSAVAQDSRYVFSRLAYDISRASSVVTPANPGDETTSLVLDIGGTTYTYAVDTDGRLTLSDGVNTNEVTSEGSRVTSIGFTKRGDGAQIESVSVNIYLESKIQKVNGPSTFEIITTIGVR